MLDPYTRYVPHRFSVSRRIGYWPSISNPTTFNEKILRRKLFDHNPLFPVVTDKLAVKAFVADMLGKEEAGQVIVPTYHVTSTPGDLPFEDLPDEYVVKPNHLSGSVVLVTSDHPVDKEKLVDLSTRWLATGHGIHDYQWAYHSLKPAIIVEKLIRGENGAAPRDYKFFVFHGAVRMIQVDHNRFDTHTRTLFRPDWSPVDVKYHKPRGPVPEKPHTLEGMTDIAERLGAHFDFVRVDLYSEEGDIYVGELTLYPESGKGAFVPVEFDSELGRHW